MTMAIRSVHGLLRIIAMGNLMILQGSANSDMSVHLFKSVVKIRKQTLHLAIMKKGDH